MIAARERALKAVEPAIQGRRTNMRGMHVRRQAIVGSVVMLIASLPMASAQSSTLPASMPSTGDDPLRKVVIPVARFDGLQVKDGLDFAAKAAKLKLDLPTDPKELHLAGLVIAELHGVTARELVDLCCRTTGPASSPPIAMVVGNRLTARRNGKTPIVKPPDYVLDELLKGPLRKEVYQDQLILFAGLGGRITAGRVGGDLDWDYAARGRLETVFEEWSRPVKPGRKTVENMSWSRCRYAKAEEDMTRRCPLITIENGELVESLRKIAQVMKISIAVSWPVEAHARESKYAVDAKLEGKTVEEAIKTVVGGLKPLEGKVPVTFEPFESIIIVASNLVLADARIVRAYWVGDLLEWNKLENHPEIRRALADRKVREAVDHLLPLPEDARQGAYARARAILCAAMVAGRDKRQEGDWIDNLDAAMENRFGILGDRLMVRQTWAAQKRVERLLDQLRAEMKREESTMTTRPAPSTTRPGT